MHSDPHSSRLHDQKYIQTKERRAQEKRLKEREREE